MDKPMPSIPHRRAEMLFPGLPTNRLSRHRVPEQEGSTCRDLKQGGTFRPLPSAGNQDRHWNRPTSSDVNRMGGGDGGEIVVAEKR